MEDRIVNTGYFSRDFEKEPGEWITTKLDKLVELTKNEFDYDSHVMTYEEDWRYDQYVRVQEHVENKIYDWLEEKGVVFPELFGIDDLVEGVKQLGSISEKVWKWFEEWESLQEKRNEIELMWTKRQKAVEDGKRNYVAEMLPVKNKLSEAIQQWHELCLKYGVSNGTLPVLEKCFSELEYDV